MVNVIEFSVLRHELPYPSVVSTCGIRLIHVIEKTFCPKLIFRSVLCI